MDRIYNISANCYSDPENPDPRGSESLFWDDSNDTSRMPIYSRWLRPATTDPSLVGTLVYLSKHLHLFAPSHIEIFVQNEITKNKYCQLFVCMLAVWDLNYLDLNCLNAMRQFPTLLVYRINVSKYLKWTREKKNFYREVIFLISLFMGHLRNTYFLF